MIERNKLTTMIRWGKLITLSLIIVACKAQLDSKQKGEQKKELKSIVEMQEKAQYKPSREPLVIGLPNFCEVVKYVTPAVVHIRSKYRPTAMRSPLPENDPFREFFGDEFFRFFEPPRMSPTEATGSGVILTSNGYIVTNYHVIKNADEIEVTLHDNRTFTPEIIGVDPSTDLALLKIEADSLMFIPFGNSDSLEVGEWVLAVGNPFNLSSTVTAGIVSAKARNIHILRDRYAIESFIQTDAAVNPGNSGGALVNVKGELVGINTAIATPTGVYAGYAFAIPSNIVRKVVDDLLNFGQVQRGFLGIVIRDMNSELAEEYDIEVTTGVFVDSVMEKSAAKEAGIKPHDVILEVDGKKVAKASELIEYVARKRPGEKVKLKVYRKGKTFEVIATLKNREGTTELLTQPAPSQILDRLGIEVEPLSQKEAKKLGIEGGVKVKSIGDGLIKKYTNMRPGFIITKVDNKPVKTPEDIAEILKEKRKGGVLIEGRYPDLPGTYYYAFGLN